MAATMKYSFTDDYSEGAHPHVLSALTKANLSQHGPYGDDLVSEKARETIRNHLGSRDIAIHFVPSGTSANAISIAACLRPHEAVIAASSGHIVVRETGAIEAKGHKIIVVDPEPRTGKLTPDIVLKAIEENWHFPHMAKPKLVYISQATEIGTVYTKSDLKALRAVCDRLGLLLFMDGARLPAALASSKCDLLLTDVLQLTDIFWIGGTKNGALLGEAIVIKDSRLAEDFGFHVKQAGCLLAKSWVMGVQFAALFERNLFHELASHANHMAATLAEGIIEAGGKLVAEIETNQVFAVLKEDLVVNLQESFGFYVWGRLPKQPGEEQQKVIIRLVTSWATEVNEIERFLSQMRKWNQSQRQDGRNVTI